MGFSDTKILSKLHIPKNSLKPSIIAINTSNTISRAKVPATSGKGKTTPARNKKTYIYECMTYLNIKTNDSTLDETKTSDPGSYFKTVVVSKEIS